MKCNEINDMMSLYIDGELEMEEKLYFENHLKQCSACKKEFESYKSFINILQNIKEESPPNGYCERLHNKLINANSDNKSGRIRWIKYGGIAAALIIVLSVISTFPNLNIRMGGMSKNESISYDSASPEEAPQEESYSGNGSYNNGSNVYDKNNEYDESADVEENETAMMSAAYENNEIKEIKIIKTGNIAVETEDYDKLIESIMQEINITGGYLEKNNTHISHIYDNRELKYGSLVIRVPQDKFYEFVKFIENSSKVQNKNILETNVTKEYYEKDNKVKNLELQEEHLRLLFDKSDTVEEMLQIENELRRIRTEIDALNISLSDIDDRASMSTVDLEVNEVLKANLMASRENVWDRARDGFINTVNSLVKLGENIIIWMVSSSPILIPVLIILIIIFIRIRKRIKKL
jgi:hypothetical protein